MKKKLFLLVLGYVLLFIMAGCTTTSHFGVPNQALTSPDAFGETEAVIASAERSEGAKYCPEKIARAKELGKKAAEIYWACHYNDAMALLAEARNLAREAESCQPPRAEATPTPPPPPLPTPPPPVRQPISFHSIHFDFDKSNLRPEARFELDRAVNIIQNHPNVVLELQGSTDSVGTPAYNRALGDRRARAVFDYLQSKGIDPNILNEVSFGETKPVATNVTDAGRALNRRVDFVVLK